MAEHKVSEGAFLDAMGGLSLAVSTLRDLYDLDPTLNDRFDVQNLAPMSIDEWAAELGHWMSIEDEKWKALIKEQESVNS